MQDPPPSHKLQGLLRLCSVHLFLFPSNVFAPLTGSPQTKHPIHKETRATRRRVLFKPSRSLNLSFSNRLYVPIKYTVFSMGLGLLLTVFDTLRLHTGPFGRYFISNPRTWWRVNWQVFEICAEIAAVLIVIVVVHSIRK